MKLDQTSVEWAITSLDRHGDTDLFPKPVELKTLTHNFSRAVAKICALDISSHQPSAPRRFIVPKDDLSYRAATQLDPLDSVILTALVYQYGHQIEKRRRPTSESSVFSYRFSPSPNGDLYASQDAWNRFWSHAFDLSESNNVALVVDISDFYNQIYHHTIENQLVESGFPNQVIKWILRLLETVSAKVSRGIPTGPHAAHILAEASLIPVDNSLSARGLTFCRFVDDIIVFSDDEPSARTTLYQIAEILDKQQRLQLQKGKTKILTSGDLRQYCRQMIEDRPINDLERLILEIIKKYSKGDPYRAVYLSEVSDDDLKAFQPEAVEKVLEDYLSKETPDFVRLRWFLRRLAQVGHEAAVAYCLSNFEKMMPAVSDICNYFVSVSNADVHLDWEAVGKRLVDLLDNKVVNSNEYFQMSILSLFHRKTQLDHIPSLVRRYRSSSPFLRREIILAAAEASQPDWLRELKEEVPSMDPWTKRSFFYAARQLPAEERKFFLRFASADDLMESLIIDWAKT